MELLERERGLLQCIQSPNKGFMTLRTEEPTRKRLWGLMGRLPYGSKGPLAGVCGFAGRRRLWAVARFNAYLTKPVARRLDRIMDAIEAGELVLCATGRPYRSRYGQYVWVWREKR